MTFLLALLLTELASQDALFSIFKQQKSSGGADKGSAQRETLKYCTGCEESDK